MSDPRDLWMVGDVLDAMSGSKIPNYVIRIAQEVQDWLAGEVTDEYQADLVDIATGNADRNYSADLEYLFNRLEWAGAHADIVPAARETGLREDAVILSVGPIVLDEGMRMMVDHAALFAAGTCKRVWLVSDTWIVGDILSYIPHIRALRDAGIELRFLLVTPWGYSEIPWNRTK